MRKLILLILTFFVCCSLSFNAAAAKWTFLIFLNGKNDLNKFGILNLKAMEKVGSTNDVNIVVEWGDYYARKTVRMLMKKSNDPNIITSPILEDLGEVDMGSYTTLQDFIRWGVQNYPAEHYFINVWDHGTGWHLAPNSLTKTRHHHKDSPILTDISTDFLTKHSITTEQLGMAMNYAAGVIGHKVDIYGSDACLMGMAEVADQMSKAVDVYVGAQEVEPALGWPYAEFLAHWVSMPNASPAQVAAMLVKDYVASYQNGSNGKAEVTLSAYDMSKLILLNYAVSSLGNAIRNLVPASKAIVTQVAASSQYFTKQDYRDLVDFSRKLTAKNIPGLDPRYMANVEFAVKNMVIANGVTPKYANATGISIWLPTTRLTYNTFITRYRGLQFHYDTRWGDAMAALHTLWDIG